VPLEQVYICPYIPLGAELGRPREGPMTDEILTISVPEAGRRYFGLSRNGSYAAAARGEIPTIRVGRLLRVPMRAMEQRLEAVCRERNGDGAA
jgi:hypothetical protein